MDSERIPCSLLQGQASEYIKEKFIALRLPAARVGSALRRVDPTCCGESSKGVIAMKKMMSLSFFAFTPAYGTYVEDKVAIAEQVEDDSAVEVARKGLYGFMKTDLVVTT